MENSIVDVTPVLRSRAEIDADYRNVAMHLGDLKFKAEKQIADMTDAMEKLSQEPAAVVADEPTPSSAQN